MTTGIILCGGKSERMGTDKSFLKINDIPIIERMYSLLSYNFKEILLISNEPAKYLYLTEKVYKDIYPGLGPLSGIHSGLKNSKSHESFIISCDMPFVTTDVIELLLSRKSGADIILTKTGNRIHPLCGIYSKNCLKNSETLLKKSIEDQKKNRGKSSIKLYDLIHSCNTLAIDLENHIFNRDLMFNMNSYEDYLYVKSKLEK